MDHARQAPQEPCVNGCTSAAGTDLRVLERGSFERALTREAVEVREKVGGCSARCIQYFSDSKQADCGVEQVHALLERERARALEQRRQQEERMKKHRAEAGHHKTDTVS